MLKKCAKKSGLGPVATRSHPENDSGVDLPETRYARTADGVHVAYQVVGEGRDDLVWPGPFYWNCEYIWQMPQVERFLLSLGSFSRFVMFDPRGSGLSDRVSERDLPTLEHRVGDALAVLDAVGSERAAFFCFDDSGPVGALFAAMHPQRISALVLYGSYACGSRGPGYPWGESDDWWEGWIEGLEARWGDPAFSEDFYKVLAPSVEPGEGVGRTLATYFRLTASPGHAVAMAKMERGTDVRDVLPSVHTPTLVLHRSGDLVNPVGEGRYLAEHIAGARFVELEGPDHLPWIGDSETLIQEIEKFLGLERPPAEIDRVLTTVLFTDVVGSTETAAEIGDRGWKELLEAHNSAVRRELGRFRGREVDTAGDGFLATFDGPARAVLCAKAVFHSVRELGLEIRAGVHTGECELIGGKVGGISVHIGARVASFAGPGEIFVSSTVKDLVVGSGLVFEDTGEHELKGVPDRWRLYRVID
jgi:class 3 adenylate cyclase